MEENTEQRIDLTLFSEKIQGLKERIASVIVGQEQTVDLVLTAILANGHVLIEGVPGVAKTLLARLTARLIDADFSRIQFTPDLMPSDVLGTTVFNMKTNEFDFHKGPIFADIVLVDEINRAPAKTQSALFEVMEERQISIDGTTHRMGELYTILATFPARPVPCGSAAVFLPWSVLSCCLLLLRAKTARLCLGAAAALESYAISTLRPERPSSCR